jgi:hypothetical protein
MWLANELLDMIDAGASNKQTIEWLMHYEAECGPALVADAYKLLGIKLLERAKDRGRA